MQNDDTAFGHHWQVPNLQELQKSCSAGHDTTGSPGPRRKSSQQRLEGQDFYPREIACSSINPTSTWLPLFVEELACNAKTSLYPPDISMCQQSSPTRIRYDPQIRTLNHPQHATVRATMESSFTACPHRWSSNEEAVPAGIFSLSGLSCIHDTTPGRHPGMINWQELTTLLEA